MITLSLKRASAEDLWHVRLYGTPKQRRLAAREMDRRNRIVLVG